MEFTGVKQLKNKIKKIHFIAFIIKKCLFNPITIEISVCAHCNLNCKGCSHYSPISSPSSIKLSLNELHKDLINLKKISRSLECIRIMGGEPLLYNNLIEVLELVRNSFKSLKIELVTNGIKILDNDYQKNKLFWETCRKLNIIICLTIYPIDIDYKSIINFFNLNKVSFNIYNKVDKFIEFKLNQTPSSKFNYYSCGEQFNLQLYNSKLFSCAQCAYINILNARLKNKFYQHKKDYIKINKINQLRLRLYLILPKPFCSFCQFPRTQVNWEYSNKKKEEWLFNQKI
ncbi:MAG: radical SAM protein [Muribaculaceae bacterium]|nr:radical SAM protein [Muribaculaceae bacterium]